MFQHAQQHIHTQVSWFLAAAAGVAEEATQVVGAAVERTVAVEVWVFLLLFPHRLLPVSIQVDGNLLFLFLTQSYPLVFASLLNFKRNLTVHYPETCKP